MASAKTDVAAESKWSTDKVVASDLQIVSKLMSEVAGRAKTDNPSKATQISSLTEKLIAADTDLKMHGREALAIASITGRRVYDGCYDWAKRHGMIAGTQVKIFKDEDTDRAADLAANMGEHFCRCVSAEFTNDPDVTDAAKLELAHQFATRDQVDNQALALVFGQAAVKCQVQMTGEIIGK
jgi:hypothetical protein